MAQQKTFKELYDFDKRKAEAEKIRGKYEDRVPVIVERSPKANIADIDKKKFLVPGELTVAQFTYVIRKRIKLTAEQALYLFVETEANKKKSQTLPVASQTMSSVYQESKDKDGFLYITYTSENTMGTDLTL